MTKRRLASYGLNLVGVALLYALITLAFTFNVFGKSTTYIQGICTTACYTIIMVTSLNLVVGFMGEFSMGHAGFVSVGAYVSAIVSGALAGHGLSDLALLLVAILAGGLAAGIMARLGFMKSFPKALITACVAGFVAVLISTPLNVIFWGGTTGNVWGDMVFAATQAAGLSTLLGSFLDEIVVDVPDKIITLIVVYFVLKGLPRKLTALYDANAKIEHLE